jgi:hypothetical protein
LGSFIILGVSMPVLILGFSCWAQAKCVINIKFSLIL